MPRTACAVSLQRARVVQQSSQDRVYRQPHAGYCITSCCCKWSTTYKTACLHALVPPRLSVCLRGDQRFGARCVRLVAVSIQHIEDRPEVAYCKYEVRLSQAPHLKVLRRAACIHRGVPCNIAMLEAKHTEQVGAEAHNVPTRRASENMPSPGNTTELAQLCTHSCSLAAASWCGRAALPLPQAAYMWLQQSEHCILARCRRHRQEAHLSLDSSSTRK